MYIHNIYKMQHTYVMNMYMYINLCACVCICISRVEKITTEEVERDMRIIQKDKATGPDEIPIEA